MIPLERKGEPDTPRPQRLPHVYLRDRVTIAPSPSLWPPRRVGRLGFAGTGQDTRGSRLSTQPLGCVARHRLTRVRRLWSWPRGRPGSISPTAPLSQHQTPHTHHFSVSGVSGCPPHDRRGKCRSQRHRMWHNHLEPLRAAGADAATARASRTEHAVHTSGVIGAAPPRKISATPLIGQFTRPRPPVPE